MERRPQFCSMAVDQDTGLPSGGWGPRAPAAQADSHGPLPTVRLAGGGLGPAAAAVLPVVPAVQLRLPLRLLLPRGECARRPEPLPPESPWPTGSRPGSEDLRYLKERFIFHSASFLGL